MRANKSGTSSSERPVLEDDFRTFIDLGINEKLTLMSPLPRTLLLITASSPDMQRVRRSRVLNFQQVTMPYLAAFVPPHWTVLHVDEAVAPVDFRVPADLVAITFHTPSATHAYDVAARFRQRGITVVLGGPHVTLMPDEAQRQIGRAHV